jgi:hypothetical protein
MPVADKGYFCLNRKQFRRLNNIIRRDAADTQKRGQVSTVHESKHIEWTFTCQYLSANAVDMRKDQVYRILGKMIKGFPFGDNIPKNGVVFLHFRLLA